MCTQYVWAWVNFVHNLRCLLKNLRSQQKFYATAGCTGCDKYELWHVPLIFPEVQHNPPLYIHPCFWCASCALSFHAWSLFCNNRWKFNDILKASGLWRISTRVEEFKTRTSRDIGWMVNVHKTLFGALTNLNIWPNFDLTKTLDRDYLEIVFPLTWKKSSNPKI